MYHRKHKALNII